MKTALKHGDLICFLSALHIAAMYGQAKLIDILIQHGSLPDATDYLGCTPLHLTSQKGYQNIIVSTYTLSKSKDLLVVTLLKKEE